MSKQETIEEVAEKLSKNAYKKHSVKDDTLSLDEQIQRSGGFIVGFKEGMKEGAKWQAQRMYSKEDLEEAFKAGREGDMVFNNESPKYWDFKKWFEQFKKK
jgi:hypothetical protein